MVCASEDVGLAYPQIIPIVKAAVDAAMMLGLPEARIPLADAVILVATSPKSNSAYSAINAATADVKAGRTGPVRGSFRICTMTARITRTRVNSTNTPTNTRTIGSISSICRRHQEPPLL